MITAADEVFLRRALRLAMNGRGHVEPNPMVGCVLVKNGQTIGEGWHQNYGQPHAEPNALADCKARGSDPAGATAYVTLEPCCHLNKMTPPCAPRLIEAKIARVVIGCLDPNPDVNGKGVAMLKAVGIEVETLGGSIYPTVQTVDCNEAKWEFHVWASDHPRPRVLSPAPQSPKRLDASQFSTAHRVVHFAPEPCARFLHHAQVGRVR